jgi:hypothetical protein
MAYSVRAAYGRHDGCVAVGAGKGSAGRAQEQRRDRRVMTQQRGEEGGSETAERRVIFGTAERRGYSTVGGESGGRRGDRFATARRGGGLGVQEGRGGGLLWYIRWAEAA